MAEIIEFENIEDLMRHLMQDDEEKEDIVKSFITDTLEHLQTHLNQRYYHHFTANDIDAAENISVFGVTDIRYNIDDFKAYTSEAVRNAIEKSGVGELLNTDTYKVIHSSLSLIKPELLKYLSLNTLIDIITSNIDEDYITSLEYHKIAVLSAAADICISKKNISFNNAIKQVCESEIVGNPAYRLRSSLVSSDFIFSELRHFKDFVIENDEELAGRISAFVLFSLGDFVDSGK